MLSTIFKYEIKHWIAQPFTYIFAFLFFFVPFGIMWGMAGESTERFGGLVLNSPFYILRFTSYLNIFIYFLLPVFIGGAIYRDYKDSVHTFLYSFPFSKSDYLLGKFLSSFLIVMGIVSMIGLGCFIGTLMPGTNPELLTENKWLSYIQPYFLFIFPNLFLLGAIVFGIVTLSRNIYAGFVTIVVLILIRAAMDSFFADIGNRFAAGIFEPLGLEAFNYHTEFWTPTEKNEMLIPIKEAVVYNRLFWTGIASTIFIYVYQIFSFSHQVISFSFRKNSIKKTKKINYANIQKINLPTIRFDYSFLQQLKTTWYLSNIDFKYIIKSPLFISLILVSIVFMFSSMSLMNPRFGTEIYPTTWLMLKLPLTNYSGIINLITFLFTGLLLHRTRLTRTHQLVDITPVSDWVLFLSKFSAIIKMQMVLLFMMMIGGIGVQIFNGYYNFEIGHYLFELYGLHLIHFIIWACMAFFIHSLIKNIYLAFFLLIVVPIGFISLFHLGPEYLGLYFLEQGIFRYNQGPGQIIGLTFSDMDGYGAVLPSYFIHKIYWMLAGMILLLIGLLCVIRGFAYSFKERIKIAMNRLNRKFTYAFLFLTLCFLGLGFSIYREGNILNKQYSLTEKRQTFKAAEKKYKKYQGFIQPKITEVKIDMDISPSLREFKASGKYVLINKSGHEIDTLILNYLGDLTKIYKFNKKVTIVSKQDIAGICNFDILKLENSLLPGDSLTMEFQTESKPITWLSTNTYVKNNGTYINDDYFPRFGNWLGIIREILDLPLNEIKAMPTDSLALNHSFISKDSDRIKFETIISTDKNQTAIAPGYLAKKWSKDGRNYFQYKMEEKIAHSFLFMSGEYGYKSDHWENIKIEIYYHKDHDYNLDRMMDGLKAGLAYCTENFSPYQHKHIRIVEFSQTGGASAHAFPNTIPTGEEAGFIQHICANGKGGLDLAFGTAVHETAHQWWGHQVIPADVLGSKMITESMAEYVNVMVRKKHKGDEAVHHFLKHCRKLYLKGRNRERKTESPLIYTRPDQNYIHYAKGVLSLYAMADFIGENNLNSAIKKHLQKVAFQENEYTTSLELLNFIKRETPDSLMYLINDMFETVTMHENKMLNLETNELINGKYEVEIEFNISKYRNGKKGAISFSDNGIDSLTYESKNETIHSLPLNDFIEIGVFNKNEEIIYLEKIKVEKIKNNLKIIVDDTPEKVVIDPYLKLMEVDIEDNKKKRV